MFGNDLSQEVRFSFKERYSGNVMDFSVGIYQAKEFYNELGRRIKQAETGRYSDAV